MQNICVLLPLTANLIARSHFLRVNRSHSEECSLCRF